MKSTTVILAAILAGSGVSAHAHEAHEHGKLSPRQSLLSNLFFKTKGNYTDSTEVTNIPLAFNNPVEAAKRLIAIKEPYAVYRIQDDTYTSPDTGITHVHFKQQINGLDVANADYKVNVRKDGRIFSFGGNFVDIPRPNNTTPFDGAVQALRNLVSTLSLPIAAEQATAVPQATNNSVKFSGTSGALSDPIAKLVYYRDVNGKAQLSWQVETDVSNEWLISYVNAEGSNEVLAVVNYVSDATYNVYKWPMNDPTQGERTIEIDPYDRTASEFGWESDGVTEFDETRGNNGKAQGNWNGDINSDNDPRPVSASHDFDFPYDLNMSVPHDYVNASITQLWYTANKYHDLLWHLGFTEAAGNFENNNNGAGGKGNDGLILNAQDGAGLNNADFTSPPDGSPGRIRMFLWNTATPWRDGSFESAIIVHEYTHGLSTRLTGGPANANCLTTVHSRGMGEGWSDFFATAVQVNTKDTRDTDYVIAAWAYNNPKGIRAYKYSTNLTTNPYTLESINGMVAQHSIGTVWCSILYEVMWNLIDAHGNTDADLPGFDNSGVPTDGRFLSMKLISDGLGLQPCNPGLLDTRDAILDADRALTGGRNVCLMMRAFAKRGMGVDAKLNDDRTLTNGFALPRGC